MGIRNPIRSLGVALGLKQPTIVLETESKEEPFEYTFTHRVERTVSLIHLAQGGSVVIEYMNRRNGRSDEIEFYDMNGIHGNTGRRRPDLHRLTRVADQEREENHVATFNSMAISHRQELGRYEVVLERDAIVKRMYDKILNPEIVPDDCKMSSGAPRIESRVELDTGRKPDYEFYDGELVNQMAYKIDEWTSETRYSQEKEMADIVEEHVQSGQSLQAIGADGNVLLPEQATNGVQNEVQAIESGEQ
jgi:hypothetical protein